MMFTREYPYVTVFTGTTGMASHAGPMYAVLSAAAQRGNNFGGFGGFNNQTVVDKAPPEIHHMIDPYWYQFPPMNPLWFGILGFVICCLGFISIIGNGMVVYIFVSTKSLRTPSNLLVINLAFSDFCMMFTMSPPMVCIENFNHFISETLFFSYSY